jgi:hypothetical protein
VLRLVSAVLSEISDDWETDRSYLNMKARWPARSCRHLQKKGCFIHQAGCIQTL